jgi:hypothetical protein
MGWGDTKDHWKWTNRSVMQNVVKACPDPFGASPKVSEILRLSKLRL